MGWEAHHQTRPTHSPRLLIHRLANEFGYRNTPSSRRNPPHTKSFHYIGSKCTEEEHMYRRLNLYVTLGVYGGNR